MRIIKVRIKNFRCIKDSGDWYLTEDRMNVLVGKNATGKTSIIDALTYFRPDKSLLKEDLPLRDTNNLLKLNIKLEFIQKEIIEYDIQNLIENNTLEISKLFKDQKNYEYELNNKILPYYCQLNIQQVKEICVKLTDLFKKIGKNYSFSLKDEYYNIEEMNQDLDAISNQITNLKKKHTDNNEISTNFNELISKVSSIISNIKNFEKKIEKLIPSFEKFNSTDFLNFKNEIPYDSNVFQENKFMQLIFKSIDVDFKELEKNRGNPQIIEQITNRRNRNLEEFLNKNRLRDSVLIEFKFYPEKFVCLTQEHGIYPYLNQRSTGEQWLFIFLIFIFNNVDLKKTTVILIDEPSINLHPNAQKNIVKILEEYIYQNPNLLIIYATHSPYLIPPEKIDRVGLTYRNELNGTYVKQLNYQKLCDKKNQRLENLCTIDTIKSRLVKWLTVATREGLFGDIVVLCEGETEYFSLPIWAKLLNEDFDQDGIILIETRGKDAMIDFAEFFDIYEIPFFLIFDNDYKPNSEEERSNAHKNRILLNLVGATLEDFPTGGGEKYFAFNPEFEKNLRNNDPEYNDIESKISNTYGLSKGIRAKYVAHEYLELHKKPPNIIKELISRIYKFKKRNL